MINISTIGVKSYIAKTEEENRNYLVDIQGPADKLFIFFNPSIDPLRSQKLFSKYLKDNKCIGVYPVPLNRPGGRAKAEWSSKEDFKKDLAFFQHLLIQFPKLKVCIGGISNGSIFALRLAASGYANYVAAFAGAIYEGLEIVNKPNVYLLVGKLDTNVPFKGGFAHDFNFYSAYDSVLKFTTPPVTTKSVNYPLGGHLITYTSPNQTNKVQLFVADNDGHAVLSSYKGLDLKASMFSFFNTVEVIKDDKL